MKRSSERSRGSPHPYYIPVMEEVGSRCCPFREEIRKKKKKEVEQERRRRSLTTPTVPSTILSQLPQRRTPNPITETPLSLIPSTSTFPTPTPQEIQPHTPYVAKLSPIIKSLTKPSGPQLQIPLTLPISHFTLDHDAEERLTKRVADILAQRIQELYPNPSYSAITQLPAVPSPSQTQRIRSRSPESTNIVQNHSLDAMTAPTVRSPDPPPLMSLIIPKPANLPLPSDPDDMKRPRHGSQPTIVPNLKIVGGDNCWKCGHSGHSHRVCKAPKRWRYCYLCGWKDVDVTTCPQCKEAWKRNQYPK
ncbi:hypothetical protein PV328_008478 [Microctonus aethiopoides]|uniref:CCHC-type domain-containing protein n=1 Tax=Microctonus aethiopoides TaxID=144406 RepID=A0AA39FJJ4_9HYME|nr:hypothetical protein PV328_008478 [Microctonus aethiopoides]